MKSLAVQKAYEKIFSDCVITTAASKEFAPYLFNLISSLKTNFPEHPTVLVFDLGLSFVQRRELLGIPGVELREVPKFAPFWNLCWSWKPVIWTEPKERYVLHLDAGVLVLRSLELLFLSIAKHGYLVFDQGQTLEQITPKSFLKEFALDSSLMSEPVFAAGVFGFDRRSFAGKAVEETAELSKKGYCLGWSKKEWHRSRQVEDKIERDCDCFRHDQTLINLMLRKYSPQKLNVRDLKRYLGISSVSDHPKQFLWHARRKKGSLQYFWNRQSKNRSAFLINRLISLRKS